MRFDEINETTHVDEEVFNEYFSTTGHITFDEIGVNCSKRIILIEPVTQLPFKFHNVNSEFRCANNNLTSLYNCPDQCISLTAHSNPITTLKFLPKSCTDITIDYHENLELLRLLLVDNLSTLTMYDGNNRHPVESIIDKILYLDRYKNLNRQQKMLELKRLLISNGYESNARL